MKKPNPNRYSAPSLERGLAILEYLAKFPHGKTQQEIAQALNYPITSVFRLTLELENAGYLQRDANTKVFSHTYKMLLLGQRALSEIDLIGNCLPKMRQLRDELQDTILLGVLNGTEVIVVEQALGSQLFRFSVNAGHRIRAYCSAPGKAIIAHLPETQKERVISQIKFVRFNQNTITCAKDFRAELKQVLEQGYALDQGEEYEGIYCVGAAILDRNTYPLASIWVTGPSNRVKPHQLTGIGAMISQAALQISHLLGYKNGISDTLEH